MRSRLFFLIILLSCFSTPAKADGLLVEGGTSFPPTDNNPAFFFGYQKDTSRLFDLDSYYAFTFGFWDGPCRNKALAITRGVRWKANEKAYISFEVGGAYAERTTENLGVHFNFAFRLAFGIKTEKYDVSLAYRHFSSGKDYFRWTEQPNEGEDFATIRVVF